MEKYTINRNFGFFKFPFILTSNNDNLSIEEEKNKMFESTLNDFIGDIKDYELVAFQPNYSKIVYDIFFHHKIDTVNDPEIRNILSEPYTSYYDQMSAYFASFNPAITSFPSFWNSFCYPFYNKKDTDWYDNSVATTEDETKTPALLSKRFARKSYLYNSFLKITYYTTPYLQTQEKLFEDVVYVNDRWCELEGDINGSWPRPTFNVTNKTEGYYLYWLKEYNIDKIYAKFEFWDALNGRMIPLMPTSPATKDKKWVQSVNIDPKFDIRFLFLEDNISYTNRIYVTYEFNYSDKTWNIKSPFIELYEVVFDDYFKPKNPHIFVQNGTSLITPEPVGYYNVTTAWLEKQNVTLEESKNHLAIKFNEQDESSFYAVRYLLDIETQNLLKTDSSRRIYMQKNAITNLSPYNTYLKDIQITLEDDYGSTLFGTRLYGQIKEVINGTTTYTFSVVPNPSISEPTNTLQPNFKTYYYPERSVRSSEMYGYTTAEINEVNKLNWWESSRSMHGYYPINFNNFQQHGKHFAENLIIRHNSTPMTPISPSGKLNLDIFFGLGKNYTTTYVEPRFYELCAQIVDFIDDYNVNLKYAIRLYFNNQQGTLSVLNNTVVFYIDLRYLITYRYKPVKPIVEN